MRTRARRPVREFRERGTRSSWVIRGARRAHGQVVRSTQRHRDASRHVWQRRHRGHLKREPVRAHGRPFERDPAQGRPVRLRVERRVQSRGEDVRIRDDERVAFRREKIVRRVIARRADDVSGDARREMHANHRGITAQDVIHRVRERIVHLKLEHVQRDVIIGGVQTKRRRVHRPKG